MPVTRGTSAAELPRGGPAPDETPAVDGPPAQVGGDVTAVLVGHDGERWLPEVLAALAASTVRPRRTIAVDTGSTDSTGALLAAATGGVVDRVVTTGRDVAFGAAVAEGLAAEPDADGGPSAWVWLLHDDSAPAPTALAALLAYAGDSRSAALLGAKARDWADPRLLVEVGVTTDRAGHRETGLEPREHDQGQHDTVRDVLAVGTAGALVRRDVWDALGGLDPALPVFRDELDLGWRVNAAGHRVVVVPAAVVRHARAATTAQRRLHAATGRLDALDRRGALFVLLAHAPAARLPLLVARLLLATVLRVLGFLLTRQPVQALDEITAAASVLLHPGRLRAARRRRAATRTVPAGALRPLFAGRRPRARARAEAVATWLGGGSSAGALGAGVLGAGVPGAGVSGAGVPGAGVLGAVAAATPVGEPGASVPTGGGADDAFDLDEPVAGGLLRRLLLRPGVLLTLALLAVALLAERHLLSTRGGLLAGGRLLPAPGGARDLWAAYAASWHPVSVGSATPAPPLLALLAVPATLLLGKAWLAVDVVLLGSVPLAGAAAYVATRTLVPERRSAGWPLVLRLWVATTWALLPVATGALAAGRLDTAVGQVALPLLLPAGVRLVVSDPAEVGWRRAWGVGLGLAVLTAFAPVLWPVLAVAALVGLLAGVRRTGALRRAAAVALALAVPVVLLLPWSASLLDPAGRLLHGPGRVAAGLAAHDLPGWHLALLAPGGPGLPATWLTAGLVLAALGGTLRRDRRALAGGGWVLALVGLAGALLLARLDPQPAAVGPSAPVWPGAPLQVAAAGLLTAAFVAGLGARGRLLSATFGWRQVTAGAVAALAAVLPVASAAALVERGAGDPLERGGGPVLPAFVRSGLGTQPGLRVLALRRSGGRVTYALQDARGVRLGAADTPPDPAQVRRLDDVVGDLLAPTGSDAADALATRGVGYVALPAVAGTDPLAAALDAQTGLVRRAGEGVLLWQVASPAAHLSLLSPGLAGAALAGGRAATAAALRTSPPAAVGRSVPAGPAGRLLVLAEAADPGWRATLDGQALPRRTAWGWATAFALPADGGRVRVWHAQGGRRTVLVLQVLGLLVVAVLAGPGGGGRSGLERQAVARHVRRSAP